MSIVSQLPARSAWLEGNPRTLEPEGLVPIPKVPLTGGVALGQWFNLCASVSPYMR